MKNNLIIIMNVTPLNTPVELVPRGATALRGPGVGWRHVLGGIRNSAGLMVKYQDRLVSNDAESRQEVYAFHVTQRMGAEPIKKLNVSQVVFNDLHRISARHQTEDETPGRAGLIVTTHLDQQQLSNGAFDAATLADLTNQVVAVVEGRIESSPNLSDSEEPKGLIVDKVKGFICRFDRQVDLYLRNLKINERAVVSTFRDVVWSSIGDIPGKTSIELLAPSRQNSRVYKEELPESVRKQFKTYYRQVASQQSKMTWQRAHLLSYSDNRRKLPPKDWDHVVDADLLRAFDADKKVKFRKPQQDIQHLEVKLKTYERIFVESKSRGKSSANQSRTEVPFEIKAGELIGQTFDQINEGDFVDVWRIDGKVKATPHAQFTQANVREIIERENAVARTPEALIEKIDSLRQRTEKLFTEVDAEKTWCEAQTLQLKEWETQLVAQQQPTIQTSAAQSEEAMVTLRNNIKTFEKELEQKEIALHDRLSQLLREIRSPQDSCLMALAELHEFLQVHKVESIDEQEQEHLNALQEEVNQLLKKYRQGRDEINRLSTTSPLNNEDETAIRKLPALFADELSSREKPSDVLQMQQKGFETIVAMQARNISRLEQSLQECEAQLKELEKFTKTSTHYLNHDLSEWISSITGYLKRVKNQIAEQQKEDVVSKIINWTDNSWAASMNHPWVKRQALVEDTYLEVKFITRKLEEASQSLMQNQQALASLKEKVGKLLEEIKEQSPTGEKLANFVHKLTETAPPDLAPGLLTKLADILVFIAKNKEDTVLLNNIEKALTEPAELAKLEAIDQAVISSKVEKEEYGVADVLNIYEERFALQAVTDWAAAMSDESGLAVTTERERFRHQLSKMSPELKLPRYETDANFQPLRQDEARNAKSYVENLRQENKRAAEDLLLARVDDLDALESISGHTPLQTFDEFLASKSEILQQCLTPQLKKLNERHAQLQNIVGDASFSGQDTLKASVHQVDANLKKLNSQQKMLPLREQGQLQIQLHNDLKKLEEQLARKALSSPRQSKKISEPQQKGSASKTTRRSQVTPTSSIRPSLLRTQHSAGLAAPSLSAVFTSGQISATPEQTPPPPPPNRNLADRVIGFARKALFRDNNEDPPTGPMNREVNLAYEPIDLHPGFDEISKKEIKTLFEAAAATHVEKGHSNFDHNVVVVMESDETSWQVALELASKYPGNTTLVAYNPDNKHSEIIAGPQLPLTETTRVHIVGHGRIDQDSKDAEIKIANQTSSQLISNIDHIFKKWGGSPGHISLAACDAGDVARKVAEGLHKKSGITPSVSAITQPFRVKDGHKIAVTSAESVSGAKLTYQVQNGETKMIQSLSKAYKATAESLAKNYIDSNGITKKYRLELPGGNKSAREYSVVSADKNHVLLKVFGATPCYACMNRGDFERLAGALDNKNIDPNGNLINSVRATFKEGILQSKAPALAPGISSVTKKH